MHSFLSKYKGQLGLFERAERGLLPSRLNMFHIACLWANADPRTLPTLTQASEHSITRRTIYLQELESACVAGKVNYHGDPQRWREAIDSLAYYNGRLDFILGDVESTLDNEKENSAEFDVWAKSQGLWIFADKKFVLDMPAPLASFERDDFISWAKSDKERWQSIMDSALALWLSPPGKKEKAKRKSAIDKDFCRAGTVRFKRENPDTIRDKILSHVIKAAPKKQNGEASSAGQVEKWIRDLLPGYRARSKDENR